MISCALFWLAADWRSHLRLQRDSREQQGSARSGLRTTSSFVERDTPFLGISLTLERSATQLAMHPPESRAGPWIQVDALGPIVITQGLVICLKLQLSSKPFSQPTVRFLLKHTNIVGFHWSTHRIPLQQCRTEKLRFDSAETPKPSKTIRASQLLHRLLNLQPGHTIHHICIAQCFKVSLGHLRTNACQENQLHDCSGHEKPLYKSCWSNIWLNDIESDR